MLAIRVFVMLVATWAFAHAKTSKDTEPVDQAKPGELSIEDLNNATISGEINFSGHTRWSGDGITHAWTQNMRFRAQIGPGSAIKWSTDHRNRLDGKEGNANHF